MRTVLSRLRRAGEASVDAVAAALAAVRLHDADRTGAASRRLAVLYCAVAGLEAEGRAFTACEARCCDVRLCPSPRPLSWCCGLTAATCAGAAVRPGLCGGAGAAGLGAAVPGQGGGRCGGRGVWLPAKRAMGEADVVDAGEGAGA
jgi:hypothetical protein